MTLDLTRRYKEDMVSIAQQLRQEGRQEERFEVAKSLIQSGVTAEVITQATKLTLSEIQKLSEEMRASLDKTRSTL